MKQFNGYGRMEQPTYEQLPKGAYVIKLLNIKEETNRSNTGSYLKIAFDIAEGQYADFYKKAFDSDTREDRKWNNDAYLFISCPQDNSEQFIIDNFNKFMTAIEDSNEGYFWDWDEKKWKGKMIGLIYGEVGTVIEGKPIEYTECRFPESVAKIRSGDFKIPNFKARKGYDEARDKKADEERNSDKGFMNIPDNIDEDLPF